MQTQNEMTNPFAVMENNLVERISAKVIERVTEEISAVFNVKRQEARFHSRTEASRLLKMSLPTVDKLIKEGVLQSVRVGRKVLIPAEFVDDLVGKDVKYKRK